MEGKEKWYSLAPMPGCEDPQVRCTPSNGHKAVDLATNKPQFTAQGEILLRCAATFPAAQRQQQLASRHLAAESALAVSTLSAGQAELLGGCGGNNSTFSALILLARRLGQERRGGGRACRKASAAGDGRGGGYGKSISSPAWANHTAVLACQAGELRRPPLRSGSWKRRLRLSTRRPRRWQRPMQHRRPHWSANIAAHRLIHHSS